MTSNSSGITVHNAGAFNCTFRVKSDGKETPSSTDKATGSTAVWSFDELTKDSGFKEGDNCWVSCDVNGGVTNHQSGGNFTLSKDTSQMLWYTVNGGTQDPSWSGPDNPSARFVVTTINEGAFSGRVRVKTGGRQTEQSRDLMAGQEAGWTFDELAGAGFNEGDSCWVSIDVDGGETNHQSRDNFDLHKDGGVARYKVTGGFENPSWSWA
ncbi:hypothetical protein N0V91_000126 [Didymella pomorum]|jgi:hypothetical protein|uniref:Uncharacterized protein n=1 Tax=Didymella pomorum TaxID=749634 RepID=A0A9W8ZQF0_9PLEO|nr:hypothetical protein N0V91_000126 [Didymella pomorum]